MTPGLYNFPNQYAGDTFDNVDFVMVEILAGIETPIDLTGYAINLHALAPDGITLSLDLSIGNGITVTSAVDGEIRIGGFLTPDYPGLNPYDAEFTSPAGVKDTYFAGGLNINEQVTK